MLRFIILLCLCLFSFSGAWCEEQAAAESFGTPSLAIWGGNGDESLSSVYFFISAFFSIIAPQNHL